jgi:hypothetical protein
MNQGWYISGEYWTTTDAMGKHTLSVEGHLEAGEALDPEKPHYVGFVIGSEYKVSDEVFWTGYEPQGKDSFYRHYPRDSGFDFVTTRATRGKKAVVSMRRRNQ